MVDWLVENIADKHTRMMEVGCGNGHLLVELVLKSRNVPVYLIDLHRLDSDSIV